MSENTGPLMLCATKILKPPPTTIANIGGNVTLPRPVAVRSLLAGIAGFFLLAPIGLLVRGFQGMLIMGAVGAFVAVALITWEPQKGETLAQILGVAAQSRIRQKPVKLNSATVSVSVGVARISRVALGRVHILADSVNVRPGAYDERGVVRTEQNRNLALTGMPERMPFPDVEPAVVSGAAPLLTQVEVDTQESLLADGLTAGSGDDHMTAAEPAGWRVPNPELRNRPPKAPTRSLTRDSAEEEVAWDPSAVPDVTNPTRGRFRAQVETNPVTQQPPPDNALQELEVEPQGSDSVAHANDSAPGDGAGGVFLMPEESVDPGVGHAEPPKKSRGRFKVRRNGESETAEDFSMPAEADDGMTLRDRRAQP
jgi:hypothetical protein